MREDEWFDDDVFWEELYPFLFHEARFDAASEDMDGILSLARLSGTRVLDLCCGPGRHSVELATRGFEVTGIDRTAFLLAKAESRAALAGVAVEWVRSDMRDFVRPGAYDLAISMFTSLGYFEDPDQDVHVLENIHRSLVPGGTLVIDVMGKEVVAGMFQPTIGTALPDGSFLVQKHRVLRDWTRMENEWIVIRDDTARTFTFEHTIYSGLELRERLERAGFRQVTLHGGLDGSDYDNRAKRLIAVAVKDAGEQL